MKLADLFLILLDGVAFAFMFLFFRLQCRVERYKEALEQKSKELVQDIPFTSPERQDELRAKRIAFNEAQKLFRKIFKINHN